MRDNNSKKLHGQFYTTVKPSHNELFMQWFERIENRTSKIIIEPFAGSNNIVKMVNEFYSSKWACFDIDPCHELNSACQFPISKNDSLKNFPTGFSIAITNPLYLARNSATRDGLAFPDTQHDDLYKHAIDKHAIDVMLRNVEYVAAIIPDSFRTQKLFHDRLFGIASLNCKMFDDTECPVCLALFIPFQDKKLHGLQGNDFHYYKGNVPLGFHSEIQAKLDQYAQGEQAANWKFNVPDGEIGLYAIDSAKEKSIRFVEGEAIAQERVKHSSRGVTRIAGLPGGMAASEVIAQANIILGDFRDDTSDLFLTSFRGLREDGDYRRRLDYNLAKMILNRSVDRLGGIHA